jgi:tRNA/tmRNA/rRNA uracil-C5-methylase (TrmA/RlmC/RlmD family)
MMVRRIRAVWHAFMRVAGVVLYHQQVRTVNLRIRPDRVRLESRSRNTSSLLLQGLTTDLIDCDVTGMTAGGDGVARSGGKVVFISGALPGERVRAEIVHRGAKLDRARLVEVLEAKGRQPTPCRHDHAGGCGGCSLLHATRAAQAAAKRGIVGDALVRLAGIRDAVVRETLTPGPDLGYRNHARFAVDRAGRLAYVAREHEAAGSGRGRGRGRGPARNLLAIDACMVLHPRLDDLRAALDGLVTGVEEVELRIGTRTGERLVVLHGAARLPPSVDATRIDAAIMLDDGNRLVPVRGAPWIHDVVLDRRFRISARSFFQVNTDGAEELARVVRDRVAAGPHARALDLYAGVGLFTMTALAAAGDILAVEIDKASVADLRHNAAGRSGVRIRNEEVADVLRDLRPGRDVFDLAVINPPRAGMGEAVVRALVPLGIPRLVLVSCDPGSLGRDVAALTRAGYSLREAVPVDQFPGTPHVETVAVLERGV